MVVFASYLTCFACFSARLTLLITFYLFRVFWFIEHLLVCLLSIGLALYCLFFAALAQYGLAYRYTFSCQCLPVFGVSCLWLKVVPLCQSLCGVFRSPCPAAFDVLFTSLACSGSVVSLLSALSGCSNSLEHFSLVALVQIFVV